MNYVSFIKNKHTHITSHTSQFFIWPIGSPSFDPHGIGNATRLHTAVACTLGEPICHALVVNGLSVPSTTKNLWHPCQAVKQSSKIEPDQASDVKSQIQNQIDSSLFQNTCSLMNPVVRFAGEQLSVKLVMHSIFMRKHCIFPEASPYKSCCSSTKPCCMKWV